MTITTHTPYKEPGIEMYRVETIKETDDRRRIQPGYIFYAPFPRSGVRKPQWIGPHIIDTAGVSLRSAPSTGKQLKPIIATCLVGQCYYRRSHTELASMPISRW